MLKTATRVTAANFKVNSRLRASLKAELFKIDTKFHLWMLYTSSKQDWYQGLHNGKRIRHLHTPAATEAFLGQSNEGMTEVLMTQGCQKSRNTLEIIRLQKNNVTTLLFVSHNANDTVEHHSSWSEAFVNFIEIIYL